MKNEKHDPKKRARDLSRILRALRDVALTAWALIRAARELL